MAKSSIRRKLAAVASQGHSKVRYVPAHPLALERIHHYLQAAGHGEDADGPLLRPLKKPAGRGDTNRPLTHGAIYHRVLGKYAKAA